MNCLANDFGPIILLPENSDPCCEVHEDWLK